MYFFSICFKWVFLPWLKTSARQGHLILNKSVRNSCRRWRSGKDETLLWSHFSPQVVNSLREGVKLDFLALLNISSLCEEQTAAYEHPHVSVHAYVFMALKLLSRDTSSKHPCGLAVLPGSCSLYGSRRSSIWNSRNPLSCLSSQRASEVGTSHEFARGELRPGSK